MSIERRPCPFCQGTGVYRESAAAPPRELRWTLAADDLTGSHVSVAGEITETASFDRLRDLPRPVVLDLEGVSYVNTMGALHVVRLLEALGHPVTAQRCSPAVVRQLNLIPGLADHLRVISVMLPYECPTCRVDHLVATPLGDRRPSLPIRRCGACDAVLELDEPLDQYLAFLPA